MSHHDEHTKPSLGTVDEAFLKDFGVLARQVWAEVKAKPESYEEGMIMRMVFSRFADYMRAHGCTVDNLCDLIGVTPHVDDDFALDLTFTPRWCVPIIEPEEVDMMEAWLEQHVGESGGCIIDDQDMVVFGDRADAERFAAVFGGKPYCRDLTVEDLPPT